MGARESMGGQAGSVQTGLNAVQHGSVIIVEDAGPGGACNRCAV